MTRLAQKHGRSVEEWVGRTNDSAPPPRVVQRILERHDRRCHISGDLIHGDYGVHWQIEHVVALANGGENRESNMAPALIAPHKAKTARDRKVKKRSDAAIKRRYGIKPKWHRPIPGSRNTRWKRQYNRETGKWETVPRENRT